MADRTSAGIFGEVFTRIKDHPDERREDFLAFLWGLAGQYDFSWGQMGCDDALLSLGLAVRGFDPERPQWDEMVLYKGEAGFEQAKAAAVAREVLMQEVVRKGK